MTRTRGETPSQPDVTVRPPETLAFGAPRPSASTDDELEPVRRGLVLADKFVIEAMLGQGGMGAVYRANHRQLGAMVAVKFMRSSLLESKSVRARFWREVQVLARCRHPGVVSILDAGEHQGTPWIAMELLHGESWASRIAYLSMVPSEALEGVAEVFKVLAYVHKQNVIHRDLKPGNVMRLTSGAVKVLDFGLVYEETEEDLRITSPSVVIGTPAYMAPEQCLGRAPVPASDIYSTGIMLYELLTSRLPFEANGPGDMMSRHLYEMVPPLPESVGPGAASIDALLRQLTEKDPLRRPTATEALSLIEEVQAGLDPVALARRNALERARVGGLGREERALRPESSRSPTLRPAAPKGLVAVDVGDPALARSLRGALATAGIGLVMPGEGAAALVLVDVSGLVEDRLATAAHAHPAAGVVLLGVADLTEMAAAVRAGARDAFLVGTSEAEVVSRVRSLLRRRS
ncbi:MAG: serine/threonine protein kinase [Myxococcales bacterium]|nr:serine/threonine protein kinase [Myxococcales bacterium]